MKILKEGHMKGNVLIAFLLFGIMSMTVFIWWLLSTPSWLADLCSPDPDVLKKTREADY
jgi:hypothetical protein